MTEPTSNVAPLYSTLRDESDLAEIIELFVDELPQRAASLLRLFESGETELLRRMAHQLKGAAGSHGFEPVSREAARLEEAIVGRRGEHEIREAVERLGAMCRRCRAGAAEATLAATC